MGQPSNPLCDTCREGGATTCDHLDAAVDQITGNTPAKDATEAGDRLRRAVDETSGRRSSNGRRR